MKRKIYIFLFTIFGVLASFFIHAALEILYINLLTGNFDRWSLGLSWENWFFIHGIFSVVLLLLGIGVGFHLGRKFADYFKY